jgi:hypothetical protein
MNLVRKLSLLVALVVFLFAVLSMAAQNTKPNQVSKVRGRVARKGSSGNYPVAYVRVTLAPRAMKDRRQSVYTGSDGMFYFFVRPGSYILEVWDSENKSIAGYYVRVDRPNVDLDIEIP